ncbi:unnamed protein product [Rotaria sp. Silwood1]|nr:unnamed protein product [Rotaria sp. Silwood1]
MRDQPRLSRPSTKKTSENIEEFRCLIHDDSYLTINETQLETGWYTTTRMNNRRHGHTASVLTNEKVLVVGGTVDGYIMLDSTELFDPLTETWIATGGLNVA